MIDWGPLDERGVPANRTLRPFEVAPRDAAGLIHSGKALVVDCRTDEERAAVRLENSIHIPLDELEDRIDQIQPEPAQPVLVLCHHGRRSVTGAMKLQARGLSEAKSIFGGLDLWSVAVDSSVPRYTRDESGCRIVES